MALGDQFAEAGISAPSFSFAGASKWILIGLGALMVAGLFILAYYYTMNRLRYNKVIILHRKVGDKIQKVGEDKGMFQRLGKAGDYWLITKKFKKILPRPSIQVGRDEFWYYEREDGEWINFGFGDFDEDMKEAGAYYVDEDMRLHRLGIEKNLNNRLQPKSFWDKYGTTIMSVIFFMIITICVVVIFKQINDGWAGIENSAKAVEKMAEAVNNLATRTGGGVVPA